VVPYADLGSYDAVTVAGQEVGHLRKINAPIEQEGLFEGF
jgi:hypothetical protein